MASIPTPSELLSQEHIRDSKVADILASNIITLVAAYIAVGLRFLSRRTAKTEYKADDWLIVPALVFITGEFTTNQLMIRYGVGRHSILFQGYEMRYAQSLIAAEVLYCASMLAVKSSIPALYYRTFFVSRTFTIILLAVFLFCLGFLGSQGRAI